MELATQKSGIPSRRSWKQDLAPYLEIDRRRSLAQIASVVLPYLGVFLYLIAQGSHMAERRAADIQASQAAFDERVRSVASNGGSTDQIAKAKQLLDSGTIDQVEYDRIKAQALA